MPQSKNGLFEGLNNNQLEAVKFDDGPCLIIAGAGTGKTTVTTRRIANLIATKKAKPCEILALTFTEKAAAEMEERVDVLVPYGYVDTWIMTFHAFGDRILKENFLSANLSSSYNVLNDVESSIVLKNILPSLGLNHLYKSSNPSKFVPDILGFIGSLQNEALTSVAFNQKVRKIEFEDQNEKQRYLELARIYVAYDEEKVRLNKIDFGDQILKVIDLFEQNPSVLAKYQSQFKYILIDEFQDTDIAQNKLLNLLCAKNQNIMVVGDDDQAIYEWRGAAVENIIKFKSNYLNTKTIVLVDNYRSTSQILDRSYKLIQFNNPLRLEQIEKIAKKLKSNRSGIAPEHIHCENGYTESSRISQIIKEQVSKGRSYRDFAILFRAKSHAREIITTFQSEKIPFQFPDSSGLYDREEIRLINNFLRAITDSEDSISLFYLATSEIYNIKGSDLIPILSQARRKNRSFFSTLQSSVSQSLFIDNKQIEKLLRDISVYHDLTGKLNTGQIVYKFLTETGYLSNLLKRCDNETEAQIKLENISAYFKKIKEFQSLDPTSKVFEFIENLKLMQETGENPSLGGIDPDIDAVNLMTAHSSKGLEFPVVFIISLTSDRFPTRDRSEAFQIPEPILGRKKLEDAHIREERRLFYVAMTRAKDELYLTNSDYYENNSRRKKISPFIVEALGNSATKIINFRQSTREKLSLFDSDTVSQKLEQKFFRKKFLTLNPHQIDDYLTCPKKFEYLHIFEIPVTANSAVSFGSAIHSAFGFYLQTRKIAEAPSLEDVLAKYSESWSGEGFETREAEDKRKQEGIEIIKKFYLSESEHPTDVEDIEKAFVFEFDGIKIRGRFDLVAKEDGKHRIIDFKTSSVDDKEAADKRAKDAIQMKIYALAMNKIENINPKVSLYFVGLSPTGELTIGDHEFSEKELEKVEGVVLKVSEGLKQENFDAKPGYNECAWCAYKNICPHKIKS